MSAAAVVASADVVSTRQIAEAAKRASRVLAPLDEAKRNAALEAMAVALEAAGAELFEANAEDLKVAASMSGNEALSPATMSRLKLNEVKLREMVEQVRSVAALPDPLGRTLDAIELDDRDPEITKKQIPSGNDKQRNDAARGARRGRRDLSG